MIKNGEQSAGLGCSLQFILPATKRTWLLSPNRHPATEEGESDAGAGQPRWCSREGAHPKRLVPDQRHLPDHRAAPALSGRSDIGEGRAERRAGPRGGQGG